MVTPGVPPVPHVGGPILPPGAPTVLIGNMPAARISDMATCVGPPDVIVKGSPTVLIGYMPAARLGDQTAHGGVIVVGLPTVMIGDSGSGSADAGGGGGLAGASSTVPVLQEFHGPGMEDALATAFALVAAAVDALVDAAKAASEAVFPHAAKAAKKGAASPAPGMTKARADKAITKALADQRSMLQAKKAALTRWNAADQKHFKKWFGKSDAATKKTIGDRIDKMLDLNKNITTANFKAASDPDPHLFAQVTPDDSTHTVELGKAFASAPDTGANSKAGTLSHEMSHFDDMGATDDHQYGESGSKKLAKDHPDKAVNNADNFEYYLEDAK
jgi:uncharacterized Zn-binding protein involved in type VI secretion